MSQNKYIPMPVMFSRLIIMLENKLLETPELINYIDLNEVSLMFVKQNQQLVIKINSDLLVLLPVDKAWIEKHGEFKSAEQDIFNTMLADQLKLFKKLTGDN